MWSLCVSLWALSLSVCVSAGVVSVAGGAEEREKRSGRSGMRHRKEEPHTRMWGTMKGIVPFKGNNEREA